MQMREAPSNPRSSLLAVWMWPRWVWGCACFLLMAAYILSAIPAYEMAIVLERSGHKVGLRDTVAGFYSPVIWFMDDTKAGQSFRDWETAIVYPLIWQFDSEQNAGQTATE